MSEEAYIANRFSQELGENSISAHKAAAAVFVKERQRRRQEVGGIEAAYRVNVSSTEAEQEEEEDER